MKFDGMAVWHNENNFIPSPRVINTYKIHPVNHSIFGFFPYGWRYIKKKNIARRTRLRRSSQRTLIGNIFLLFFIFSTDALHLTVKSHYLVTRVRTMRRLSDVREEANGMNSRYTIRGQSSTSV